MRTANKVPLGSRRQPEVTRAAILKAATAEFARSGLEGARTDEIARAAGVNKALLYYYFQDKEALYGAVLDQVFGGLREKVAAAMDAEPDPGRRLLAYAAAHFDYVASSPQLPRVVLRELLRVSGKPESNRSHVRTGSPHIRRIVEQYMRPIYTRLASTLSAGVVSGQLRPVDPQQAIPSVVGTIVFYFVGLPAVALLAPGDPLSPERLAERRAAVLDFIAAALFRDPVRHAATHGGQP